MICSGVSSHIPTPASDCHYDLFMCRWGGGMGMRFCLSSYDLQIEGGNFSDLGMWKSSNVERREENSKSTILLFLLLLLLLFCFVIIDTNVTAGLAWKWPVLGQFSEFVNLPRSLWFPIISTQCTLSASEHCEHYWVHFEIVIMGSLCLERVMGVTAVSIPPSANHKAGKFHP